MPPLGLRYMVAAALAFSAMSALVKLANETLPVMQTVFARAFIGLLLSLWMLKRAGVSPWGVRRGLLLTRGLLGFAGLTLYFYALGELPLADATVIMYTNPIWTALIAGLLLREAISGRVVLASLVALCGVALVARPALLFDPTAPPLPLVPVLLALAGALCAAGAYVSVRALRSTDHILVVVLYFPLVAAPASLPFMIPDAVWPTLTELLILLGVGVSVQIAQVFMTRGLHLEPAGRATAVSYLQVAFAYAWGLAAFSEAPTPSGVLGAALVIAAASLVAFSRTPPPAPPPAATPIPPAPPVSPRR